MRTGNIDRGQSTYRSITPASFTNTRSDSADASYLTFAVLSNTRTRPGTIDLWYFPEYDVPWQRETFLRTRWFAIFAALGFIGFKLFGYVQARFAVLTVDVVNWQNWSQSTQDFARNGALQVVQGLIALANGGVLGAGFGLGHTGIFVPVAQSDMVFTALGEEFGWRDYSPLLVSTC